VLEEEWRVEEKKREREGEKEKRMKKEQQESVREPRMRESCRTGRRKEEERRKRRVYIHLQVWCSLVLRLESTSKMTKSLSFNTAKRFPCFESEVCHEREVEMCC
jgi:hypothetical protein